jgi:hypothetical protein
MPGDLRPHSVRRVRSEPVLTQWRFGRGAYDDDARVESLTLKNPPPLVAEVLDRFQDGDGSHGDDLLGEPGPLRLRLALFVEDGQT